MNFRGLREGKLQGSRWVDGGNTAVFDVRPNVPQMAELPCIWGVVDSTPKIQDRTSRSSSKTTFVLNSGVYSFFMVSLYQAPFM